MSRGLNKTTIAREAQRQLRGIVEMLTESGNWDVAGVRYHAHSANNYIAATRAVADEALRTLPEAITRNAKFLQVHGWTRTGPGTGPNARELNHDALHRG